MFFEIYRFCDDFGFDILTTESVNKREGRQNEACKCPAGNRPLRVSDRQTAVEELSQTGCICDHVTDELKGF